MSRLKRRFEALKADGRKALIPFVTAGDPRPESTVPMMHALVEAGADVIELGVPFSDPMADGPVIQRASERALAHHVSLRRVLEMVREFRRTDADTPVVLMGYLNPVEVMGYAAFAGAAAEAGVDGVLTVDLPPEEAQDFLAALGGHGLDPIFLVAPTTDEARVETLCRHGGGFIYYVSVKGVTGGGTLDFETIGKQLDRIRAHTELPVGVGFGISDAASAARMAGIADAVIVGSAIVRRIEEADGDQQRAIDDTSAFVADLRRAIDGV